MSARAPLFFLPPFVLLRLPKPIRAVLFRRAFFPAFVLQKTPAAFKQSVGIVVFGIGGA